MKHSIDLTETYAYGTSKDLVSEKEEIKCIKKLYKKWLKKTLKENIKVDNPNWPEILDHPYRILIIGGSVSGKKKSWLNLVSQQPDIDKIYSYAKDPYEAKNQFLI